MTNEQKQNAKSIARILIKQINDESSNCSWWLMSAVNRILVSDPDATLKDFFEIIKKSSPDNWQVFQEAYKAKEKHVFETEF